MKKIFLTVAAVVALAVFSVSGAVAFAAEPFANPTYTLNLGDGFTYKESKFMDGGANQAAFIGEYSPSANSEYELVIHSVRQGSKTTKTTVMDIAKHYEKSFGRKVIMATNGDYFDLNTGSNIESYVNDGVVISKGSFITKHCIGFDNNGKSVVGRMTQVQKRLLIEVGGEKKFFEIDKFNAEPAEGEIAVYTYTGAYQVNGAGKYVIHTDSANMSQYPVWGKSHRMTTGTAINDDSFTVKAGQFAIVVKGEKAQYFYDNVVYGVACSLVEIPDGDFKGCNWVLGGYDILVNGGTVNTKCHTDNDGSGYAPRTFIGFKENGSAFLCVVDGRQGAYSKGITVNREAQLAKELGAYNALELDGGGSSTVILRVDDELTLRNKPSDGQMRKVSNAIMLVEKPKTETVEPPVNPPAEEKPDEEDKKGNSCASAVSLGAVALLPLIAVAVIVINRKGAKK